MGGSCYSIPNEIRRIADDIAFEGKTIYKANYYSTLDMDEEYGLTLNVYAIGYKKNWNKPEIKLAFVLQEKRWLLNSDMYFTNLGGWNMIFKTKRKSKTWYGWYNYSDSCEPVDELYEHSWDEKSKYPGVFVNNLWDYNDLVRLIPEAMYLREFPSTGIIEFIRIWRKHPQVEVIYKNPKTRNLWTDTRLWNLSHDKQKKVLPLLLQGYSLNDALGIVKYKSKEKMDLAREKNRKISYITREIRPYKLVKDERVYYSISPKNKLEMYKYINENKISERDYVDYLNMCLELKRDLKSHGVMFPKKFKERHDSLTELWNLESAKKTARKNRVRNKNYINAVKELVSRLQDIDIDTGKFEIKIPKDMLDLASVGNKMDICVGSASYDIKVANHESIILVFWLNDIPIECCELKIKKEKLSLEQLRGKSNQDSKYHKECLNIINNYIPLAQNRLFGGATA